MPLASATPVYDAADVEPKAHPDELKLWWSRGNSAYYPYKVKMVERQRVDGLDFLLFKLARNEALGPFKVELTRQTAYVWSDLPSTVQKATPERPYGFLLLSDDWEIEVQEKLTGLGSPVKVQELREGGGKWPLSAEGIFMEVATATKAVLQDANKAALDPKLSNLLDTLNSFTR
jgi:hypothetical protein